MLRSKHSENKTPASNVDATRTATGVLGMEHRLAPEQQQTEQWRTNLAISLDAVEDASARLAALESEAERQRAVAREPPAVGFPYTARTRSKTMLRKAPPTRSGMVGVLDAGVEVLVEEGAVTAQEVSRLRVSGILNGWGNADKFERLDGDAAAAATAEAVAARTPLPLDADAAVRLVGGMSTDVGTVRELFDTVAGLPAAADAEAGREPRAGFLWRLLDTAGDGIVSIEDVAMLVGRAAARHCAAQPSFRSWAPRPKGPSTPAEEGVPPEQEHEPVAAFQARAEAASQAAARADTAAANLATSQAEVQAAMATAMASGELDQVRDALSRASELEAEMAEQKEKCTRLLEEATAATVALEQAKKRAVEAIASAVDQDDDEEAVAWLSAALRRCFEDATTREWSRPEPSTKIDERWLKRWLCTGPPRRPCGEALLPWLREAFRSVLCTLLILNRCFRLRDNPDLTRVACFYARDSPLLPHELPAVYLPVRLRGDLEANTTLLRPESAYILACVCVFCRI